MSPLATVLTLVVRAYRAGVSPLLPPRCRFAPSCSAYALEALQVHGAVRGSWLGLRRLVRCQPFCAGGHDPVPSRVVGPHAPAPAQPIGDAGAPDASPARRPAVSPAHAPSTHALCPGAPS